MMNNMGGDEDVDLPEVDGADDVSNKCDDLHLFYLSNLFFQFYFTLHHQTHTLKHSCMYI